MSKRATRGRLPLILFVAVNLISAIIPFLARADQAESLYREGIRLENEGQGDFAVFKYFTITRNYPNSRWADDALFKIAEFYYNNKDYFNARETFEKLITQYPQSSFSVDSRRYLENINAVSRNSDTEKNIKSILSGIDDLKNAQKWDDVASECDSLSLIEPLSDEYRKNILEYYKLCGDAYLEREELGKAKITYEKVMRITPDDTEVLNKLYEINKLLKDTPK